ncbi:MAG: DUF429 domain-containing protein [Desulfosalsimonas sp.]|uniref:hypothetical protein n=1 Tax=Desulfosalsimonas sp. TaxID=3073848 RepID=UPI003970ADA5
MRAVAVDWSGAKNPANKIWLAGADQGSLTRLEPMRSREEAINEVIGHLCSRKKTVAGLDFGFSLPAWFFRQNALSNVSELWALAERHGEKWLSQCCRPFWGRPGKTKPPLEAHFRRTEEQCRRTLGVSPKSVFQIGGAGAVGTGSIRGMPFLRRIREQGVGVWPFDTCGLPLVVEIYPRIMTGPVVKRSGQSRADYLAAHWPDLPPKPASHAIHSEDAFDAAVSALIMDAHFPEFENLPPVDHIARLEGEIWVPDPTCI